MENGAKGCYSGFCMRNAGILVSSKESSREPLRGHGKESGKESSAESSTESGTGFCAAHGPKNGLHCIQATRYAVCLGAAGAGLCRGVFPENYKECLPMKNQATA